MNVTSIASPMVFAGTQAAGPTHGRITTCTPWILYDLFESGPRPHHSGVPSLTWSQNNGNACASKVKM